MRKSLNGLGVVTAIFVYPEYFRGNSEEIVQKSEDNPRQQIAVDFGSQQLLPTDSVIHINDGSGNVEPIRIKSVQNCDETKDFKILNVFCLF